MIVISSFDKNDAKPLPAAISNFHFIAGLVKLGGAIFDKRVKEFVAMDNFIGHQR